MRIAIHIYKSLKWFGSSGRCSDRNTKVFSANTHIGI